jgi:hypothetical protein
MDNEQYYNTLIDFLSEPEAVERWLKACIVAYAVNTGQLQSLIGCAEETIEYLNHIDGDRSSRPTRLDGFWVHEAHADYEAFQVVIDKVGESLGLLQEYREKGQPE